MGQHRIQAVHFVGKGFPQHMEIEDIAGFHLKQVGKHLLSCHAGVPG